jgi:pentatricopeptide repeat protein
MKPQISDYALIGDTRTAALVHRQGSIDWMCVPRFDRDPIFGRLIDPERGGSFSLKIAGADVAGRSYDGATLVTRWRGPTAETEVRDTLVADVSGGLLPSNLLVREVRALRGIAEIVVEFDPRLGLPGKVPDADRRGSGFAFTWDRIAIGLMTDVVPALDPRKRARFSVAQGESRAIAMSVSEKEPIVFVSAQEARRLADRDTSWWRSWVDDLVYDGPNRAVAERSLLVLRLLTYAPSGAPVAAPTTSLPEWIGSDRNWDYRYSWPRDASIGLTAFLDAGYRDEARAFMGWLLHAARITRPRIEIVYTLDGNPVPAEREVETSGFAGSRPVRIGNAARDQSQLDVYGWVIDAFARLVNAGEPLNGETIRAMRSAVNLVTRIWSEPDNGIWEVRGKRRHYVHSKIMCWLALDRAIRCSTVFGEKHLRQWETTRDEIARSIRNDGFDPDRGVYVRTYDSLDLDASILLALPEFDEDPQVVRRTIDAIQTELGAGGSLIYRYRCTDGHRGPEGAFLPCTFWLIHALARTGRIEEAEDLFTDACKLGNEVSLYSEEFHPQTGELLGNFPQALTHGSLVLAGQAIAAARTVERKSRG